MFDYELEFAILVSVNWKKAMVFFLLWNWIHIQIEHTVLFKYIFSLAGSQTWAYKEISVKLITM